MSAISKHQKSLVSNIIFTFSQLSPAYLAVRLSDAGIHRSCHPYVLVPTHIPPIMARILLTRLCASLVLWFYLADTVAAIQITGATGGVNLATGERPFRREINVFATSGAPYDLFVLALLQLQSTNQSNILSYFQISGIHGWPRIPWDGVAGTGGYPGFCTHAAVVFPTWHRTYMALYEVRSYSYKHYIDILIGVCPANYMEKCTSHCAHLSDLPAGQIRICSRDDANTILGLGSTTVSPGSCEPSKCDYQYTGWQRDSEQPSIRLHIPEHARGRRDSIKF